MSLMSHCGHTSALRVSSPALSRLTRINTQLARASTQTKGEIKKRRIATSARLTPQEISSLFYNSEVEVPVAAPLPKINHAVSFRKYHMQVSATAWILSQERPRTPTPELQITCAPLLQNLPQSLLKSLSNHVNSVLFYRLLGPNVKDDVFVGAYHATKAITRAISSQNPLESLTRLCTESLWSRYLSELEILKKDNVDISLEVEQINAISLDQIQLFFGKESAFSQESFPLVKSECLQQQALDQYERNVQYSRHRYQLQKWLNLVVGSSHHSGARMPVISALYNLNSTPFKCRLDVRINAKINYSLKQKSSRKTDRSSVKRSCTLVDDKAARDLVLTFESPHFSDRSQAQKEGWKWMLADIDQLLACEQQRRRDRHMLEQTRHQQL
ncbi:hypothetical protein H4219_001096 [Mycoemilia scoparia]|uniref:Uncharacterized protein n=1 Tax=Mycoemilia scoparia TaxID=417184 RepID=A0A9W8A0Y8_9FUNG|nr:hypothetical protein H4219_001096 [Mycoemilia scoparia]